MSKSVETFVPTAEMIVETSRWPSTLSSRAFSTFSIFPCSGRIAWKRRSRPEIALPPAESPSTMKSSVESTSRLWQSASLPGRFPEERAPFLRARSRALRAASRAEAACTAFCTIVFATAGVESTHPVSAS